MADAKLSGCGVPDIANISYLMKCCLFITMVIYNDLKQRTLCGNLSKNDTLRWPFLACRLSEGIYGQIGEITVPINHALSLKLSSNNNAWDLY